MGALLGATGMIVGIIGGLCWLIYSFLKHKSKRKPLILIVLGILFLIVGVSITPSSSESKESETTHLTKTQSVLAHLKNSYYNDYKDTVKVTYDKSSKVYNLETTDTKILNELKSKINKTNRETPNLDRLLNQMKISSKYINSKLGNNNYSLQLKGGANNTKNYYSAYNGHLNDLTNK